MEPNGYVGLGIFLLLVSVAAAACEPLLDGLESLVGKWAGPILRWLLILLGLLFWGLVAVLRWFLPSRYTIAVWALWWWYKRRQWSIRFSALDESEKKTAVYDIHREYREALNRILVKP